MSMRELARTRWLLAKAVGGIIATVAVVGWLAAPAWASPATLGGGLEVTNQDGSGPLNSGGSATQFGLSLPGGARCPGDSAHAGYHITSFAVPKGVDPTSIGLWNLVPDKGLALIADEAPYEAKNTAVNTGAIGILPGNFMWRRWTRVQLLPGGVTRAAWTVGIGCAAPDGSFVRFWTTSVIFTASRSDPRGYTWAVAHPVHRHAPWWAVGLIAFSVVGGGVWWITGRRSKTRVDPPPRGADLHTHGTMMPEGVR